jgi:hypothetical protein
MKCILKHCVLWLTILTVLAADEKVDKEIYKLEGFVNQ